MLESFWDFFTPGIRGIEELTEGDVVKFKKETGSHYGVYVGDGYVVHLTEHGDQNFPPSSTTANKQHGVTVKMEKFWAVAGRNKILRHNWLDKGVRPKAPEEIRSTAMSQVDKVFQNRSSQDFAGWCRYGEPFEMTENPSNPSTGEQKPSSFSRR